MLYGVGCGIAMALVVLACREGHSKRPEPTSYVLPLDLPKGGGCGRDIETVFRVTLSPDGTTSVDDRVIASDDVLVSLARRTFERSLPDRPAVFAVIVADDSVAHGRVVHAMDVLRQAGATEVGLGDSRLYFL